MVVGCFAVVDVCGEGALEGWVARGEGWLGGGEVEEGEGGLFGVRFFCWSKVGNGDADCSFGVSLELDRMKREWKLISFHVQLWNFIDGLYW